MKVGIAYALSICVPTYERPDDLRRCLDSIASLDERLGRRIEVCVSDNASAYDFPALIASFGHCRNLRWRRGDQNVGFDGNVLAVTAMATGEYVMLLGNDDTLVAEGVEALLDLLERDRPDAVFANYRVTLARNGRSRDVYEVGGARKGLTLAAILEMLREKITFMSSFVIRRALLRPGAPDVARCVGQHFIHVALLFEALKDSRNVAYLPLPISGATDRNAAAYDVKRTFLHHLGFVVAAFVPAYGDRAMNPFRAGVVEHVVLSGEPVTRSDLRQFGLSGPPAALMLSLSRSPLLATAYRRLGGLKRRLRLAVAGR
jgi:hypothetical protein